MTAQENDQAVPLVARITGFEPFRLELIGSGPYTLPVAFGFPPLKFKAIDLGWAVDGAYIGGEAEMLQYTINGEGQITAGQLADLLQAAADSLKELFDAYQAELLKKGLLD